jgi:hypothetical protein
MQLKKFLAMALLGSTALAFAGPGHADELADGFQNPPNAARPRVWWHWMNGNVTVDGIEKDLAWMEKIGIGGLQNFDASLGTPQVVKKRLVYMDPDWKVAFKRAVELAEQKGLEFTIAASPGWSETGGPWVKPEDGMKKLVWSETTLPGGKRFGGKLASPPNATGPFQDIPFSDPIAAMGGAKPKKPPQASGTVAVLAYPVTEAALAAPKATTMDGAPLDMALLSDEKLGSTVSVPTKFGDAPGGIILTYDRPVTVRSARMFMLNARPVFGDALYKPVLQVEDGTGWRTLGRFTLLDATTTASFKPTTGRRFRLLLSANDAPKRVGLGEGAPGAVSFDIFAAKPSAKIDIGDLRLSAEAAVDQGEAKAGYSAELDYDKLTNTSDAPGVAPGKVIDLTARVKADGSLNWTPPNGNEWRVVRYGWALTGKMNHPATPEATGLEVDKYDAAAVRRYLEHYLGMYRETVGPELFGKKGIRGLLTDSIEVGHANWTGRMFEEFKVRRGYDLKPWLPVLGGAVIGSSTQSEKFLFDFRTTLAELLADAHYGTVAKVAHEQGLKVYGEALEDNRPLLGDDMAMRKHADVPMAALWTWSRGSSPRPTLLGDMKGAASVAHIYGQNIVAAESMTSANAPWAFAPHDLKRVIDLEFAMGVNRPVIHTSVHQPLDDKQPGFSLMIFGQYFNRHEAWAGMAKPWVDYMARTSYMLQQGRNHADIAWFYGEEAPLTALFAQGQPAGLPKHFAYDFVNADVLMNMLSVEGNELVAKSGARYKALYLGGSSRVMTLSTLKRIATIADAGVPVIGEKPARSPALRDDAAAFTTLANRLWSSPNVIASRDPDAAMAKRGIAPDFAYETGKADSEILFVHRKLADGDVYFVSNRLNRAENVTLRFNVNGKVPEIWDAITGKSQELTAARIDGMAAISMAMLPEDAKFIVFRQPLSAKTKPVVEESPVLFPNPKDLTNWTVSFQQGRGAPASIQMKTLQPLNQHSDPGVKYFAGVATYTTSFMASKTLPTGPRYWLSLGKVGDVAEVRVNGTEAGTVWFAPWGLEIGKLVKPGTNTIEIRVANTWVNRLIGDLQPGATKQTFTSAPFTYKADAPLRPSGLIGPVAVTAD